MRLIKLLILLTCSSQIAAQYVQPMGYTHYSFPNFVNIGVGLPARTTNTSAYLEVGPASGANKGILFPRLTTAERDAISSPALYLMIFNKTTGNLNFYNGSSWQSIESGWSFSGDNVTADKFLGTLNNQHLNFRVNNRPAGRIYARYVNGTNDTLGLSVMLGHFTGERYEANYDPQVVAIGGSALRNATHASGASQMVALGVGALEHVNGSRDAFGNRSVVVGGYGANRTTVGDNNTVVGYFGLELNRGGRLNTGIGRDVLRSNIDGESNVGAGLFALLRNSTGIDSINVTNGGSGYTTASVEITRPLSGTPGGYVRRATAEAVIDGGVITNIVVTDPGAGYTNFPEAFTWGQDTTIAITITGDGSGATASLRTLKSGSNNTALGTGVMLENELGSYNTSLGYYSGRYRKWDSLMTFIGYGTRVAAAVGTMWPDRIKNATAIGANAQVAASNTLILGGTGANQVNVGIGATTARQRLDVVGGDALINNVRVGIGNGSTYNIYNTVVGNLAIDGNNTGGYNTAIGYGAHRISYPTATRSGNIAIGYMAMDTARASSMTAVGTNSAIKGGGWSSVAIGANALREYVTDGASSTDGIVAVGGDAFRNLNKPSGGVNSVAIGYGAGYSQLSGGSNTYIGNLAAGRGWSGAGGSPNATGSNNTVVGSGSLFYTNNASFITLMGANAANSSTFAPGTANAYITGVGYNAARYLKTGVGYTLLGSWPNGDSSVNGKQKADINYSVQLGFRAYANQDSTVVIGNQHIIKRTILRGTITDSLYGKGNVTGSLAYLAGFTSDGQIIDVDAGSIGGGIGGSGTDNEIAYWSSSSDIAALSTSTYPSLTELTYVKGVTSAIQTQLDAKISASSTNTLTNKRFVARVSSTASSGTPTINTDNVDIFKLTAQTENITSFTTNLSGTPNDGDILKIQITGTATRTITWGSSFIASPTLSLPTATDGTNTLGTVFQWHTTHSGGNNKWVIVNVY